MTKEISAGEWVKNVNELKGKAEKDISNIVARLQAESGLYISGLSLNVSNPAFYGALPKVECSIELEVVPDG